MSKLLDTIEANRTPDMKGPAAVQANEASWEMVRLWCFRRSVYGCWLWPGQTVWRYKHMEMCIVKGNRNEFKTGGFYYRWFYLYLTDEELVMDKLSYW